MKKCAQRRYSQLHPFARELRNLKKITSYSYNPSLSLVGRVKIEWHGLGDEKFKAWLWRKKRWRRDCLSLEHFISRLLFQRVTLATGNYPLALLDVRASVYTYMQILLTCASPWPVTNLRLIPILYNPRKFPHTHYITLRRKCCASPRTQKVLRICSLLHTSKIYMTIYLFQCLVKLE